MKVMVKEAKKISTDIQYPELGNKDNGHSAQVVLPRELFTKYEGNNFFSNRGNSSPVFPISFISAYNFHNFFIFINYYFYFYFIFFTIFNDVLVSSTLTLPVNISTL